VTDEAEDLDDETDATDDIYVQGLVVESGEPGVHEIHVCVGAQDIGRLKDGIRAGFRQLIVDKHLKRANFGGKVVFAILSEVTPQSPGLWRAMLEMEEHLNGVVKAGRLKTVSDRPVEISFQYTAGGQEQ
jgi:hypothetical protein